MKKTIFALLIFLVGCNSAQSRKLAQQNLAVYPWQFTTPMPLGRYGHDALYASNGKIYVLGGLVYKVVKGFKKGGRFNEWFEAKYNNGRYSNLAYDPCKKQWEFMTSIPGWGSGFKLYDPNTDHWSECRDSIENLTDEDIRKLSRPVDPKDKPFKVYNSNLLRMGNGVAIALSQNRLLWTGGQSFTGDIENIALPYDLGLDEWPKHVNKIVRSSASAKPKSFWEYDQRELYDTEIPPMQEPRRDHRAVTTSDGKIYVLGGWRKEKIGVDLKRGTYLKKIDVVSNTMECYDPETNKWEYKKPMGRERMDFAAVVGKDDKIYVFSGAAGMASERQTPILDTVEVYDPKNDTWSLRKPMPIKRSGHRAVLAADGRIYILGGGEFLDKPLNTVYIYDSEKDAWEKGPEMILARDDLAAVATPDGKIYAIGGSDEGAYENNAQWEHLASLIPKNELGDYEGKVQDTVEVLDIYRWEKNRDKEKRKK